MKRGVALLALSVVACSADPSAASSVAVAAWDPVDPAFAGCQGSCGAHVDGPRADIVEQPGAHVGQRTFCPVSGAVFTLDGSQPHADVGGEPLYFCCAACAAYFEAHHSEVLAARHLHAP